MNGIRFILPAGYAREEPADQTDGKSIKLEATYRVFEGALNANHVFSDPDGQLYVWRMLKARSDVVSEIQEELGSTYMTLGGSYKFRTINEQAAFMRKAASLGLKSVGALYTDGKGLLMSYVYGMVFDTYLKAGGLVAVKNALDNLVLAHKKGVVFGDRWVKNTIVTPDEDVMEIDFDIELKEGRAGEFEMAQTLYHMLHFSSERNVLLGQLADFLKCESFRSCHDVPSVGHFLKAYLDYFRGKEYEGIQSDLDGEVNEVVKMLQKLPG